MLERVVWWPFRFVGIDACEIIVFAKGIVLPDRRSREAWERANAYNQIRPLVPEDATAAANEMQAKRVLIICPALARDLWAEHIQARSTMPDLWLPVGNGGRIPALNRISRVTSTRYGINPVASWTIVSFDLVAEPAILETLITTPVVDLVVFDGKTPWNPKTRRTHAVFGGSPSLTDRCGKALTVNSGFADLARLEEQRRQKIKEEPPESHTAGKPQSKKCFEKRTRRTFDGNAAPAIEAQDRGSSRGRLYDGPGGDAGVDRNRTPTTPHL
jgi:hypothetical protein